jgi:hypothetical protein
MFDLQAKKPSRNRRASLLGGYFIASAIGIVWAGFEIPWSPAISIVIFAIFGASLPFVYKYGVKGEDPRVAAEKLKDFFTRGKLAPKPKPGEISPQKPIKRPAESPMPSTGTATREYKGYKERFNMIRQ